MSAPPVVLKFYRAGRWSDAQILEEHAFAIELAAAEIPVVAPLRLGESTLRHCGRISPGGVSDAARTARRISISPEPANCSGRTLGRIHAIGAPAALRASRPAMRGERLGARARHVVLASGQLPEHMRERYARVSVGAAGADRRGGHRASGRRSGCTATATSATSCGRRRARCSSIWTTA